MNNNEEKKEETAEEKKTPMEKLNPVFDDWSIDYNSYDGISYYDIEDVKRIFKQNNRTPNANYTGKMKLFKNRKIPRVFIDSEDGRNWLIDKVAPTKNKSKDWKMRFFYLLATVTPKPQSKGFWDMYRTFKGQDFTPNNTNFKFISQDYLKHKVQKILHEKYKQEPTIQNLQNYILISMYCDVETLRLDYNNRIKDGVTPISNYYNVLNNTMTLSTYKGSKYRGKQEYSIPEYIVKLLVKIRKMKKDDGGFKEHEYLLHNTRKKPFNRQEYSKLLTTLTKNNNPVVKMRKGKVYQVFKKHNFTKKSLIFNKDGGVIQTPPKKLMTDLKALSKSMLHSLFTQQEYYNDFEDDNINAFRTMFEFFNDKDFKNKPVEPDEPVEIEFIIEEDEEKKEEGEARASKKKEEISIADILNRQIKQKIINKHSNGYNCSLCHKPDKRIKRKSAKGHIISKKHLKLMK